MVVLTFSYRSTKKDAYLRLRYRNGSTSIEVPTEIRISKSDWDKYRKGKFANSKGGNKDLRMDLDLKMDSLKKHVAAKISNIDTSTLDKSWLKQTVFEHHNPPEAEPVEIIPHTLLGYWDYYLKQRDNELSKGYKKLFAAVKEKLLRFQQTERKTFEIKDVNENFKSVFVDYCKSKSYSQSTIRKDLKTIKTICRNAKTKGLEVSPELDLVKTKNDPTPKLYLSFDELDKIKAVTGLPDYLDNARDWLVISCYTAQRVSDFMRFDSSMIRTVNGTKYLDVRQKKTGKDVTVPLLPEVLEVLDKRNGNFPRPISDQRYNEWIKKVVKSAGVAEPKKGRLATIKEVDGKKQVRNVLGIYPKHKLITSHIGRKSFATNFYGKIPTTYLKNITGHGSEAALLAYIGKSSSDTAVEAYELMMNAK